MSFASCCMNVFKNDKVLSYYIHFQRGDEISCISLFVFRLQSMICWILTRQSCHLSPISSLLVLVERGYKSFWTSMEADKWPFSCGWFFAFLLLSWAEVIRPLLSFPKKCSFQSNFYFYCNLKHTWAHSIGNCILTIIIIIQRLNLGWNWQ
jgi:hypothetical protein